MRPAPLLAALLLTAYKPAGGQTDLTTRLLFTANGSYDAQADPRQKESGGTGLRRVEWKTKPPLEAAAVTVEYDGDQRPRAWLMTLEQPKLPFDKLTAEAKPVNTPQGGGFLIESGPLAPALLLRSEGQARLLTRGYAVQHAPELLPAFGP